MAKPKGGTLTRLFEVSERERQEFYKNIQKKIHPINEAEQTSISSTVEDSLPSTVKDTLVPPEVPTNAYGTAWATNPATTDRIVPTTTVEDTLSSTVVEMPASTVEVGQEWPAITARSALSSTVEASIAPAPEQTAYSPILNTVEYGPASTVAGLLPSTVADSNLWRAESAAGVFTGSRVRRINNAQDALTHVEEAVYDALWGVKKKGEPETDRLAQMGYAELSGRSRVSKRTIQSVIDRLIDKGFIEIHEPADISSRKPTIYRVLSYGAVLKRTRETGRSWVVRTGRGVFYAHRLAATVEVTLPSTVADGRVKCFV